MTALATTVQTAVKTTATIRSLVAAMMIKIKIRVSSVRRVPGVREVLSVCKVQEGQSVRKGPKDRKAMPVPSVPKVRRAHKVPKDYPEACSATLIFTH